MFHRLIDDLKSATALAARRTFFVGAAALSLFITTAFLCAAAFVAVLERYGPIWACITGAAIFFVVTLLSAGSYLALKKGLEKKLARDAKPAASAFVPDPMMIAAGLQVARAIGFKKVVPLLALAGLVAGIFAARQGAMTTDDDDPPS